MFQIYDIRTEYFSNKMGLDTVTSLFIEIKKQQWGSPPDKLSYRCKNICFYKN